MTVLRSGANEIDGIAVEVTRKRCRRISLRVTPDGAVHLTVPKWWATLAEGEAFLRSKWKWVRKARAEVLSRPPVSKRPVTDGERAALRVLLDELTGKWAARVGETGVSWKLRRMKTLWGCCHWRDRYIVFNEELAHAPRELVEYIVVHEYTHFAVHGHGPRFYALMDERLPGWKERRKRLNKRDWIEPEPAPPRVLKLVQEELPGLF